MDVTHRKARHLRQWWGFQDEEQQRHYLVI